jgi:hypothetical protein
MSHSSPFLAALTLGVAVASACTPSASGVPPKATADSAAEPSRAAPHDPVAETAPDEASPVQPPAPVAAAPPVTAPRVRPMYIPPPSGPYRVRVADEAKNTLPTFYKDGRAYVMGTVGARYSIVISNPTASRVEAVVSVDGLDAMDGHPADYVAKRGYILAPYETASIDGFRTSYDEVATFRFSSVADSYAGRLGQARDVGVIGVAFFSEQYVPPPPPVAVAPHYPSPVRRAPSKMAHQEFDDGPAQASPPAPAPAAQSSGGAARGAPTDPAQADRAEPRAEERRGLGTEFGEARASHIGTTEFTRANARTPTQIVAMRYNDRAGLVALGINIPQPYARSEERLRETADPFRENRFAQAPP